MSWIIKENDRIKFTITSGEVTTGIVESETSFGWFSIKDEESGYLSHVNCANVSIITILSRAEEELDTDINNPKPEPSPILERAKELAELRKDRTKEIRDGIKDNLTSKDLKPVEN